MNIPVLFIGILLSIVIRGFFIVNGLDVADVSKLHQIAEVVLNGGNPYQLIDSTISTYPPLSYYLEAITLLLSNISGIPFHILTKLWPNIADIVICLILYKSLIKLKIKPFAASLWSLIFILNPISIIISSAHGQIDSITTLLVLCSIYFIIFHFTRVYYYTAALFLGLAIAIKPNPAMLLPFFLTYQTGRLKTKVLFVLFCIAPVFISLIPYALLSSREIYTNIFGYSGVSDFGYNAILRGFWYQDNASIWLPFGQEWLNASKIAFLAGAVSILLIFSHSKKIIKSCLAVYLLFLGVYFGISGQYLCWILPLAILAREKMIIPFSISGAVALLGFYLFFGPEILFGRFWHEAAFQSKYILIYFLGNLMLWITIVVWVIKIVKSQLRISFKTFSPFYKKTVITSLILFMISLIPVLILVFRTFALLKY